SQAGRAISSSRNHCVDSWRTVGVVALAQIQPPHSRWIIQASARTSVVHFLFVETTFCENARDCLPRRSVVEEGRSRRFKTPHYRGQSQSPPAHRRRLQRQTFASAPGPADVCSFAITSPNGANGM